MNDLWTPLLKYSEILTKYKVGFRNKYYNTLILRNHVKCKVLKKLNNKYYAKQFFKKYNLKVPKLIYYTEKEEDLKKFLTNNYVAKPAHLSESNSVFINNQNKELVNKSLNKSLNKSAGLNEPLMLRQAAKGIIIEEYIGYDYELKVFVLYGSPIIADLRSGSKENDRVTFIDVENSYLDLKDTYKKINNISKELKIDFFRIDFLVKDNELYASEFAFRPSTALPDDISDYIYHHWISNSKK